MVPTCKEQAGNGRKATQVDVPRSVQIASGGFGSTREVVAFATALATDIMTDAVGHKTANAAVGALRLAFRAAEFQHRYGNGAPALLADDSQTVSPSCDPLKIEEAKLLAQLEQVRKEMSAR